MIPEIRKKKYREGIDKASLQGPLSWHHYADTSRCKITRETISLAGIPSDYDKITWPEIRRG